MNMGMNPMNMGMNPMNGNGNRSMGMNMNMNNMGFNRNGNVGMTANASASATLNRNRAQAHSQLSLWQWDINTLRSWVESLTIFHSKLPPTNHTTANSSNNQNNIQNTIQNKNQNRIETHEKWMQAQSLSRKLKNNLMASLHAASASPKDTFHILDPSFSRGKDQVHTPGAILSRLALHGVLNAIHGTAGGVFPDPTGSSLPTPTHNISMEELRWAQKLLRAVNARVEMDMLNSTPSRIVEMLCPEMTMVDVETIRKRIYQTVILGKGTNSSAAAAALEGEEDVPVAAKVAQHDIDKFKKCSTCGNNDQSAFVLDRKNGDLICTLCGTVAIESLLHEGSAFRKFEGEADRNHHGDVANPLYSNAHNMGTTLSGIAVQSGAGIGWGSKKQGLEKILRHTHTITEMSLSQFGKDEKKTRVGYKDRQKKDAFVKMAHVSDALSLHEAVLQQAKVLFAGFRDDRELVQQFQGVLAACLWESFEQLSKDGRQILKGRAGEEASMNDPTHPNPNSLHANATPSSNATNQGSEVETKRAGWRNEMHKASLASRKLLDKVDPVASSSKSTSNTTEVLTPHEKNEAKVWNLDDCRSWLVGASKIIAKKWVDMNDEVNTLMESGTSTTNASAAKHLHHPTGKKSIPQGSRDELEGQMVFHTLTLCDHLEKELTSSPTTLNKRAMMRNGRAFTPRVKDMSRLGIKWQKPNERGSGGKGGVGNSGRTTLGKKPGEQSSRTAGQVLLLITRKQFGSILKDEVAGDAFHTELRTLLGRQHERKRKTRGEEVARTRAKQLKRKPWLTARAEAS